MTPTLRTPLPTPTNPTLPTPAATLPTTAFTLARATFRATALTLARATLRATLRATALAFAVTAVALAPPPPPASAMAPNDIPPRAAQPHAAPPGASPHAAPPGGMPPRAVWPLNPRPEIVRGFEPPPKPWLPGHRGLDLAGSPGQPVLSATAGTITYAGPLAGRGVVVVTSGPFRTTYEPVVPSTHVGATVTPGDQLGTLSTAGTHCPPRTCLHWGLRQATTYLNPLSLLATRPVRLLPLTPSSTPKRPAPATQLNEARGSDPAAGGINHPVDTADSPADDVDRAAPTISTAGGEKRAAPTSPTAGSEERAAPTTSTTGGEDPATPTSPSGVRSSPTGVRSSPADRSTGLVPAVVVGVSAVLSLGGALLIRRH